MSCVVIQYHKQGCISSHRSSSGRVRNFDWQEQMLTSLRTHSTQKRSTEILSTPSRLPWAVTQPHNNCAETHIGGRDTSLPWAAIARLLSSTLVASTALWRLHKDSDHTAMIAVVNWRLHAKTHHAGEVVSAISFCLRHWLSVVAMWHSINWNELQYIACTTAAWASRIWGCNDYLPGVRLPLNVITVINVINVINVWLFWNGLQRFWLHRLDRYDAVTQPQNNCVETHLGRVEAYFCTPCMLKDHRRAWRPWSYLCALMWRHAQLYTPRQFRRQMLAIQNP